MMQSMTVLWLISLIHQFLPLFVRLIWVDPHYVPAHVLGRGNLVINKTDTVSVSWSLLYPR